MMAGIFLFAMSMTSSLCMITDSRIPMFYQFVEMLCLAVLSTWLHCIKQTEIARGRMFLSVGFETDKHMHDDTRDLGIFHVPMSRSKSAFRLCRALPLF
jgi:hypothetical protein